MNPADIEVVTKGLVELVWQNDREGATQRVGEIAAADLGLVVSRMDSSDRCELFKVLEPAAAASVIEAVKAIEPHKLLAQLAPETAAEILHELPSNVETDLIAAMKPAAAERILELLPAREKTDVQALARYDSESAGGLMVTEILQFPRTATVQDVIDDLRANAQVYAKFVVQYIYVVGSNESLLGVLRIRDLLLSESSTILDDLVSGDPLSVDHLANLEELRDLFDQNRYLGLPVVEAGRLVGVVRRSAVEEAVAQRTARQFRLVQGIIGGEEVRTLPLRVRSGRRLAFLSANIVLNIVAASVIVYFESTLAKLIALAAFLPIISDMSGCSGNQAVAVSMRELSLGLVRPREVVRVLAKEASVGVLNGAALGVLIGLVAWVWRGNPILGAVVGTALALNTVVAVSIGGTVPLVLRGLGIDPALASGPILTTVTDICGFFLALGLAALAMSQGLL